ncbi:hypothetical protein Q8A73_001979 [Channa argus]|nr:hypothetical protein Q8A73_001979 [Channa argus]
MCTIDLFHCDSQQWLFAPQHRAPQEEPVEHTETQSLQTKRGSSQSAQLTPGARPGLPTAVLAYCWEIKDQWRTMPFHAGFIFLWFSSCFLWKKEPVRCVYTAGWKTRPPDCALERCLEFIEFVIFGLGVKGAPVCCRKPPRQHRHPHQAMTAGVQGQP